MIRRAWRAFTRGLITEANGWATGAEIVADIQAPAPGNPRVPEPSPVPGQQTSPAAAHGPGASPPRPAPAPVRTLTVHFYNDGHAEMLDHIRRRQIIIAADDWDDALERLTRDARD